MTERSFTAELQRLAGLLVDRAVATTAVAGGEISREDRRAMLDWATVVSCDPTAEQDAARWKERATARITLELIDLVAGPVVAAPEPTEVLEIVSPVLIVEDSATSAAIIERALRLAGLRNPIVVAGTVAHARRVILEETRAAAVVLDYELPDGPGIDLLRDSEVRLRLGPVPFIMMSVREEAAEIDEAHRLGVAAYLVKPLAFDAIAQVMRGLSRPWYLGTGEDVA